MVLRVLHLLCGQWKIEGSARCAWQAVPWSRVCPELRGAGCAPAPGAVGSPGTLTDLNSVIYGFVLLLSPPTPVCIPPAPVLSTLLETLGGCALLGGSPLLPSARGLLRALWADRA